MSLIPAAEKRQLRKTLRRDAEKAVTSYGLRATPQ
jgi:hypothetical protein